MADTPNYFAILVKAKANMVNEQAAVRLAEAVPVALRGWLPARQCERIMAMLPGSALPRGGQFYTRLPRARGSHRADEVNVALLYDRLMHLLSLTGRDEAKHYLTAYWAAVKALLSPAELRRLMQLLPPVLSHQLQAA